MFDVKKMWERASEMLQEAYGTGVINRHFISVVKEF
jgi:hypothetical protein